MVDSAHRNAVLARLHDALVSIAETLEDLEGFASEFMAVPDMPGADGYVGEEDMRSATKARIPWWDRIYRCGSLPASRLRPRPRDLPLSVLAALGGQLGALPSLRGPWSSRPLQKGKEASLPASLFSSGCLWP